jgi:hypothetical protein
MRPAHRRLHRTTLVRCLPDYGESVGQIAGVVGNEAEQGRAAGVLPGQPEEVQAGASLTPRWWITAPSRSTPGIFSHDRAGGGQFRGDLHAGVSAADHHDRAFGQVARVAVVRAVELFQRPVVGSNAVENR